ncbi:MAG: glycosyltransferase family 39 protein [Candidatus Omnitrophica bacterium]|nr:glycosyltransferase family 39 protein [Candidatus Omnitrophota bacterium]
MTAVKKYFSLLPPLKKTILLCVIVFVAAVSITFLFLALSPGDFQGNENTDYLDSYKPLARNIMLGSGYIDKDGSFSVKYPPGYPLLLSGIFTFSKMCGVCEESVVSLFIVLCMGLAAVFIFLLGNTIWNKPLALLSPFAFMTHPCILWLTKQPGVEVPFLMFFYGSFCFFWYALVRKTNKKSIFFLAGIFMGFTMLIKPIALGISCIAAVICWGMRGDIKIRMRIILIAVLLAGNAVAIAPWEISLYSRTGKLLPLSTAGTYSMRDGLTYAVLLKGYRREHNVPGDVKEIMLKAYAQEAQLTSIKKIISFFIREYRHSPSAVIKFFSIKALRSWYGTDSGRFEPLIAFLQVVYLIIIARGSYVAFKIRGMPLRLLASITMIALYFWGITTLGLSIARYMMPIVGLLLIFVPGVLVSARR